MEMESRQLEQTLSKLTSELSEAFTSIDTLVAKINVSPKEKLQAERAPLLSIIGEQNSQLNDAVNQLLKITHQQLSKDECASRIIGKQVEQRIRELEQLRLWLQDGQRLLELCQKEELRAKTRK